jgi:hypothetical protein
MMKRKKLAQNYHVTKEGDYNSVHVKLSATCLHWDKKIPKTTGPSNTGNQS